MVAKKQSNLELRLECINRMGDLRLDFLKRLYDGKAVIKGYKQGNVELHIHAWTPVKKFHNAIEPNSRDGRIRDFHICGVLTRFCGNSRTMLLENEMPMLIWIRDISEHLSPIDSIIRLQSLNLCRMKAADSLEAGLGPSLESVWRVLNQELRTVLPSAGIKDREFVDEIVEASPQVIDCLSDKQRNLERDRTFGPLEMEWYARLRIEFRCLMGNLILVAKENSDYILQLRKMFLCPVKPEIGTIERMSHGQTNQTVTKN